MNYLLPEPNSVDDNRCRMRTRDGKDQKSWHTLCMSYHAKVCHNFAESGRHRVCIRLVCNRRFREVVWREIEVGVSGPDSMFVVNHNRPEVRNRKMHKRRTHLHQSYVTRQFQVKNEITLCKELGI